MEDHFLAEVWSVLVEDYVLVEVWPLLVEDNVLKNDHFLAKDIF